MSQNMNMNMNMNMGTNEHRLRNAVDPRGSIRLSRWTGLIPLLVFSAAVHPGSSIVEANQDAAAASAATPILEQPAQPAPEEPTPPEPVAPRKVEPGTTPGLPPADAIVLFDGTNLDQWTHTDERAAEWTLEPGDRCMVSEPGSGSLVSSARFDAAQIHVEFCTPTTDEDSGQARGNSGVYIQGRYEIQVLDSYENETYFNGQCGAVYGQYPPLVNASRPAGEWQTYDIIFRPPLFDEAGIRIRQGSLTVFHNGVLIQDHVQLQGATVAAPFTEGPGDGPLYLQDHGDLVRYRNIWVRPLKPEPAPATPY